VRKEKVMKIIGKMCLALVIGFLGLAVPGLDAAEIKVKCDKGQSVQSALDSLLTGPTIIVVTGTCYENIDIRKDDVTIQGGAFVGPDPEQTAIYVEGARRVFIKGATVGGAGNGVGSYQGASVTVENSTIQGNAKVGIVANFGSSVIVNSSTIQDNNQHGVLVNDNSALFLTNCTIAANGSAGVLVQRASSARIGRSMGGVLGRNTITNNGGPGVNVCWSAYALIDGNTITTNSGTGINIEGASATVTNNTIQGNKKKGIVVSSAGNARIGITEGNQTGRNIIENNVYEGIESSNSGSAYIWANTIQYNGLTTYRPGVSINRATGRLIGDNTIQANGGHGVAVNLGALFQGGGDLDLTAGDDLITGNGYSGIFGWNGASLDIRHATVEGNNESGIVLNLRSTLRIYDSTVRGPIYGIAVYEGSAVSFKHPPETNAAIVESTTGPGLYCDDPESSYIGDTSRVRGLVCTPF
jgi:hypothetical protein